mmetsp:Transcript_10799/g.30632  ORF Transcript_10799/g.30632 Transcript_10799/m.30632 type:complete len:304 (+) Transcript_10799:69-980(+)|eukprot:CAMPEP_0117672930 /NCGR_PEP_ID=MMETSP0804-20121206/14189_1 /TAXON_ID=1074897 /ORGANISM="Tetraselmis astigmatica, Strain CCMP880" /LENGTH=303 /DNA_ID=CAMNT_0005481609 /DNA_START=57 /DNA_END=968 /DNA_ORIENTATION=-
MANMPDPGAKGLQGMLCCAWIFSTTAMCLFLSALLLTTWSMAKEPATANGQLGLYSFCPNTQYFINQTVLPDLNVTSIDTTCVYVDYSCYISLGYVATLPGGSQYYTVYRYNIFNPLPLRVQDPVYELIKVFPGYGSCSGYINARIWGLIAAAAGLCAWLSAPFGLCSPSKRRSTGGTGTGCVCCAVISGIVSVSVWAASVMNWNTSVYGSGFWCMVSAIVIAAVSIPCISSYSLVATAAPQYQQATEAAGQQYGYYPQSDYQPGQQYQYGTAPGGGHPRAPPAGPQYGYNPQAPPPPAPPPQ